MDILELFFRAGRRLLGINCLVVGLIFISALPAQVKPRVYLIDRDSWKQSGWIAGSNVTVIGQEDARVVREHTEDEKTFNAACPGVVITEKKDNADYAIIWDRTNWNETSWTGHQNNLAIYNRASELVWSGATHRMQNAAKEACKAIMQNAKLNK